ncbi:HSP90-domain-containing protein [Pluteus cervinus]|uniref:HSP90-domain-containing protein n=1 Tax=Pluteus cervinus TaxID=181527 RepID=A0ACD3BCN5_9AGAR|nr:HSP90-domain-containing protein [Pluteus cervinus]
MSAPPFAPPPLPFGWTEHTGPGGQPYFYHAGTQQSTYIRPLPALPTVVPQLVTQPAKKKEKPLVKTPIPGTEWLRVKTTEGNVFYSHKVKKESIWAVPEEIKEAVEALEREEREKAEQARQASFAPPPTEADRLAREQLEEIQRVKADVQELVKRKAESAPADEQVVAKKKVKLDKPEENEEDDSDEDSEDEEWQREAAEQLAVEAEIERIKREEAAKREAEEAKKAQNAPAFAVPNRVDLSIEEAKALFKTLLREKDINPLHPWDTCLPLFVNDPRYVLLPSVAARRDAFDEYCRDRARELRQTTVKHEVSAADPKAEFERLLKEEVQSTRTSWQDFRKQWKKDRRFYGWGRDDRERERRFRDYLKELGEKKRLAAQKAEADFFVMLKESGEIAEDSVWKDIKKQFVSDPRYDAVGSSSLREELFKTFLKGNANVMSRKEDANPSDTNKGDDETLDEAEREKRKKEKKERAVREREEKMRAERERVDADISRSRAGINKEEGEREFRTLLVDAIRDAKTTWDDALPQLKTDPRLRNSPLPFNQQIRLFHEHIAHLRSKSLASLHALFGQHAPTLATRFTALPVGDLITSAPVARLGFSVRTLEDEYDKWQRERSHAARKAFDEMLAENSFVEFWGRLKQIGGEGVDGGVKADEEDGDEGEGGGGKVDMKSLAKSVDVGEVVKVLKNDKRYIMFDHVPEQRERWIRAATAMRFLRSLLIALTLISSNAFAQDAGSTSKVKLDYQSDVARLRKIVINSLYSHKEIFLRELISNANDALEKLRIVSLTNKDAWDGASPLNITIKAYKDEDGKGGKLVVTDTGIGMSKDELARNLGTLAKSGTSEFLARAEGQDGAANGHLIGAFGLGFYSSFLVADRVYVASVPPPSKESPEPVQHVFSSSADDSSFEIYEDPRGNTLARGTEITLVLKPEDAEFLEQQRLAELINKHSSHSSSFPLYLWTHRTEEVPIEEEPEPSAESTEQSAESLDAENVPKQDEDEAIVEEEVKPVEPKEPEKPKTKTVEVEEWGHINASPPLWTRDPKLIDDAEYVVFYNSFFKDFNRPIAWHHFSGDSGSGVSFKAMVYLPSKLDDKFWQQPLAYQSQDIKLMVKRVFITSDLGENSLPKWASWVKVVVDAEDLPLNVSRETLQSNKFLKQLRGIIVKRLLQMFTKLSEEDEAKFAQVQETYGNVLKLGAVEDVKHRQKLAALTRFASNQRASTSFDQYLENKKKGQKQIFYLAEMGKKSEDLARSVFIEKLHARGYEVLLLTDPLDEILIGNLREWKSFPFQDVAKAGLQFGDEDLDAEEKEQEKHLAERYQPLIDWLKKESNDVVRDVVISNRLVTSPCAIVAEIYGYTANVQKMMSASNAQQNKGGMLHDFAKKAKLLEINPRSPLIEGLLRRIEALPTDEDEKDLEAEEELKEVTSILIDGALVRSGFEVQDSNTFFTRVDRVLRRSLGVSETAPTDDSVKPAPPVDPTMPESKTEEEDDGKPKVILPDALKDKISLEIEELEEDFVLNHDEL